ncbi:hypothetical protein DM02DRAFT_130744 [Periconia macrospinosa]|uniref:Uncharacterized protein n=1 Tax=Periconia macrospinosa TaxID=97972 RepID=A0A2V1DDB2_9PLEO|nr:hypothetical protein DM02DRAFT_130744 [Periconia macrospinosa]
MCKHPSGGCGSAMRHTGGGKSTPPQHSCASAQSYSLSMRHSGTFLPQITFSQRAQGSPSTSYHKC